MLKFCLDCGWQYNDEVSMSFCPHPQLTRQMRRAQERIMAESAAVNLDQQAIASKQIAAFVTLKRLEHLSGHFQGAISFLYPPKDNAERGAARDPEADKAAHEFVTEFFKLAKTNLVDLSSGGAAEAFEYSARLDAAIQARQ